MKKMIFAVLAAILALFVLSFSASAQEVQSDAPSEPEQTAEEEKIDYDKIADDVYDKIKDELPQGIAENIVKVIEEWDRTENENATFSGRIKEFFEADNLVNTVSMLFMLFVGIAMYIMKNKQGMSIASTNKDLNQLKKAIEEQIKDGKNIGGGMEILNASVKKITDYLVYLENKIDEKQDSSEKARLAAVGVASMLRDIFQNSRTIDEAGKKIMNLNYLKAIGEPVEESGKNAGKAPEEEEV